MKKPLPIIIAVALLVAAAIGMHVLSLHKHLQTKFEKVQAGLDEWAEDGRDPSAAITIMGNVPKALKNDDIAETENFWTRRRQH